MTAQNRHASFLSIFRRPQNHDLTAALILHDVGTKDERDQWVKDFKAGKTDILFVYNMLLTGFACFEVFNPLIALVFSADVVQISARR